MAVCLRYSTLAVWLCIHFPVFAGTFLISPLRVELSTTSPIAVITVRNDGEAAGVMKLDVMSWSQIDGQDTYNPSSEVIATPPVFMVPPGGSQIVRLGLRRPVDATKELTYRLYLHEQPKINEQPKTAEESGTMKVALRFGIPVFIAPAVKAAKPVLVWTVTPESKNAWRVSAFNKGDSHVQILNTQLSSDDTATPVAQIKGMSYLLTGQKRSWMVTPNAAVPIGKKIKVTSQTDIGEQNATVQLANLHD